MKQRATILLLLITVVKFLNGQSPEELLQHRLDSISQQNKLAGFGVAVFSTDSVFFQNGFGYADLKAKKAYTVNTIQNIGSISKTFVGTALMKAIEMGTFDLDTPINDIVPFKVLHPKYPEVPIRIRDLATHTSGIIDFEKGYDKSYVLIEPNSVTTEIYGKDTQKYLEEIQNNRMMSLGDYLKKYLLVDEALYSKKNFSKYAPGERYAYSNIGSALAAYCIEVATGQSFQEFTKQYIFQKIGMLDTSWSYDQINTANHAEVYADNLQALPRYSLVTYPDGGLRTSVASLTKYMQAMIQCYEGNGDLLKTASCRKMMSAQLTSLQYGNGKETDNYGIFWEFNRETVIGHNGGDPGILTLMYYYKDIKMGAVFFTNSNVIDNVTAAKQVQACWNAIRAYQKQLSNERA